MFRRNKDSGRNKDSVREHTKLKDPKKATIEDRINDLRKRAGHYYQQTRKNGKRKMLLSKQLKITSLLITASVALLLTLQVFWVLSSPLMVLILALFSWLSAIITVVQTISFDDSVTAKLFHIAMEFYDIKEQAKDLKSQIGVKSESEIIQQFTKLSNHYQKKLDAYVEHLEVDHSYYYRTSGGPGIVVPDDTDLYRD